MDSDPIAQTAPPPSARAVAVATHASTSMRLDLAIAAWLHEKQQLSQSHKTRTAYASTLAAFRRLLLAQGLDLDAADPRVLRCAVAAGMETQRSPVVVPDCAPTGGGEPIAGAQPGGEPGAAPRAPAADPRDAAEALEALQAARTQALALAAQVFAAQPMHTRYGERPVSPATANLRLAVLSSFYTYALQQDFLRGPNPITRVKRRKVRAYASAVPLAYDDLRTRLAVIDLGTPAGQRDYALLLVSLHTGRRLSELADMCREHVRIRASRVEITWPRCKGGKSMRDVLPRRGAGSEAATALVAWIEVLTWLANGGERSPTAPPSSSEKDPEPGRSLVIADTRGQQQPIWISLATNGTFGHALNLSSLADICEKRLGTRKVHALRHTFARALEDAGAKVSEIQAQLGHESLDTTGRYLARLHQGEHRHLGRVSALYGLQAANSPAAPTEHSAELSATASPPPTAEPRDPHAGQEYVQS